MQAQEVQMVQHEIREVVENMAGGVGKAYRYHIVSADKLYGHGRMYAKVVLQPGSTIGWHQHIHETEPYYILSGEGTFIDNDKSKTTVHAGDICTIEPGQWHSMENNGQEDLVFMALIYND
jgi:mannose-6-phosphate isomerase-like protein (cupin superfamily)